MSRSDPRLFVPAEGIAFIPEAEIPLLPGQAHYLGNVMRQSVGSRVRIFNGLDGEWNARISLLRKDRGAVVLECPVRSQEGTAELTLLFAPLKRDATELVIRMGTELGVTCFQPIATDRTNTHRINPDRLMLISQEASEQCERLDVPSLLPLKSFKNVLADWPAEKIIAAALERRDVPLSFSERAYALFVGPEGGFSDSEAALLERHPAVRSLSLGPRILKAETAVCAGLARLLVT